MTYNFEIEGLVSHKHKLEAENKRLRAALQPFAGAIEGLPEYYNDDNRIAAAINGVSLRDFETASRVLKQ